MCKQRWRDRAGLVFAIGIWGHVLAGCFVGVLSASFFEDLIDFGMLATVVGAIAGLAVASMAYFAFGDWKRSLQYGRRIEHAQSLKLLIIRLQNEFLRYSDCHKHNVESQERVRDLEAAYALHNMEPSIKYTDREFRKHVADIKEEIKIIMDAYRLSWELLKTAIDREEKIFLISHEAVLGFELGFYSKVSLCNRKKMEFRDLNKSYLSGWVEKMLTQVDDLLR